MQTHGTSAHEPRYAIPDGASVTTPLSQVGHSSRGRVREDGHSLDMSASPLPRAAEGIEMRAAVAPCSLGLVLVAATPRGVCAVMFAGDGETLWVELQGRFPRARIDVDPHDERLGRVVAQIDAHDGPFESPLDLIGTAFQQQVWRALRAIPSGQTVTYAEVARRMGAPRAVRAVGTACGANPVAVLVPCHRVVRGDGALGGYRWGLARKRALLARERTR
jgi:AraC family transcriptional regulator of adaptative response/methylated-DNA-[protein]-cysteine methyltransferase